MEIEIACRPAYAAAVVKLRRGEKIRAESGALLGMSPGVSLETGMAQGGGVGGFLKSLGRALVGESFFQNTFTASNDGDEVVLAPALVGDISVHELRAGEELGVQSSAYLASTPGVEVEAKWGGGRGFFSGTGLFMMRVHGQGTVLFNAFGGIHPIDVNGKFIIDTGHVVAFDLRGLRYNVTRVGGWFSTFFSGEGLVCEFEGQGRVWIQSRNPNEFGQAIGPQLPPRS